MRALSTAVILAFAVSAPNVANALTLNVTATLPGMDYFETSVLHTSSVANPMVGTVFARFNGVRGTYDTVTGQLDLTFSINGMDAASMSGVLTFDMGTGQLTAPGTLTTTLLQDFSADGYPLGAVYNIAFTPGPQCCTELGPNFPNTFNNVGNDTFILTLWGAGLQVGGPAGSQMLGTDIQLELQPVPLPGAVWMFLTALAGLFGVQWRKRRISQDSEPPGLPVPA